VPRFGGPMLVTAIHAGGPADLAGIRPGDDLVAIGDRPIRDAVDLTFALGWLEDAASATWRFSRGGEELAVALPVTRPDELGIDLADDPVRTCGNRCIFCFVDQLPRGLRPSLYVKDEDYRLSFTHGNYITLTNLTPADYGRIAEQRLSPLYVSVHATDDAVRRRMLGNPDAPPVLAALERLRAAGIAVHVQIVVCPGINDGAVLERTLEDLAALGGSVLSIAVVPVGLTAHREGLPRIDPVSPDLAAALVEAVERWQRRLAAERGSPTVFAADELYLLAGRRLPPYDSYGDFPQQENGVGLLRLFEHDLRERAAALAGAVDRPVDLTIVTATLAAPELERIAGEALAAAGPVSVRVIGVENSLLGSSVTVAGLLPGRDIVAALRSHPGGDLALVPPEAFSADGLTLDGMTLNEIVERSGRRRVVATGDIVGAILDLVRADREREGDDG